MLNIVPPPAGSVDKIKGMPWDATGWAQRDGKVSRRILRAGSPWQAWDQIVRAAGCILRTYSSNFFLVTRFLPADKRAEVEVTYAAVRYPDEIVDSFAVPAAEKTALLDAWEESYRSALRPAGLAEQVASGIPWILAGFAHVVRRRSIPPEHYLAFLDAMRRDVRPAPFADFDELIHGYVYGSAVVVGYFLTHIYGADSRAAPAEALECARQLGVALQLTNFARDVEEDRRRGRLYVPADWLAHEGLSPEQALEAAPGEELRRAARRLAEEAEPRYQYARRHLSAFSPDCRAAIRASIEVYQAVNRRVLEGRAGAARRARLNAVEKFRLLPAAKYWRLPLAYARLL